MRRMSPEGRLDLQCKIASPEKCPTTDCPSISGLGPPRTTPRTATTSMHKFFQRASTQQEEELNPGWLVEAKNFFPCPACGKTVDAHDIADILEHHQHVIHPTRYSYSRSNES